MIRAADTSRDDDLLTRLRDLALVDLDALLAGSSGDAYDELLETFAGDLEDALGAARTRTRALLESAGGHDPLVLLDAPAATRARDGGRDAAKQIAARLAERAAACRALARLDDLTAPLLSRLIEADRRRVTMK